MEHVELSNEILPASGPEIRTPYEAQIRNVFSVCTARIEYPTRSALNVKIRFQGYQNSL